jgi:putative ABC transport system substrate-binding protein
MRRRKFFTLIGGAAVAWPLAVRAQQPFRIGLLNSGADSFFVAPFVGKLAELGYREGKNILIERKLAEGNSERLKEFAADLVRQNVDVIVTIGTPAGFAAKQATATIPIVFGAMSDPVGVGLVASLARPGGNATGNSLMSPELSAKRLEILRALVPGITRFAILWDSSNPGMAHASGKRKSPLIGRTFYSTPWDREMEELEAAFAELFDKRPDALLVTTEAHTTASRRILDCERNKNSAMFEDGSMSKRAA